MKRAGHTLQILLACEFRPEYATGTPKSIENLRVMRHPFRPYKTLECVTSHDLARAHKTCLQMSSYFNPRSFTVQGDEPKRSNAESRLRYVGRISWQTFQKKAKSWNVLVDLDISNLLRLRERPMNWDNTEELCKLVIKVLIGWQSRVSWKSCTSTK